MMLSEDNLEPEPFEILLSQDNSRLLIVDYQEAFSSCFDKEKLEKTEFALSKLAEMALKLEIPIVATLLCTNSISAVFSKKLRESVSGLEMYHRSCANPWNDSDFSNAFEKSVRTRLIVAGISAETSLSFSVLSALERGFDVYVIQDLCLGNCDDSRRTTFERLSQAGAIMVTWRQVALEWNQNNVSVQLLRQVFKT